MAEPYINAVPSLPDLSDSSPATPIAHAADHNKIQTPVRSLAQEILDARGIYAGLLQRLDANDTAVATTTATGLAALVKSANLSDLTNAVTARSNLGLGNAATKSVGTTAGTVADGDVTTQLTSWTTSTPTLFVANNTTPTQVTQGSGGVAQARYLKLPYTNLCLYEGIWSFGTSGAAGVGNYLIQLPFRASTTGIPTDRPFGSAATYSLFQSIHEHAWPSLADTFSSGFPGGTTNADYIQFFNETKGYATGTGSIVSAATISTAINHGLGYAPDAADIQVVATNDPTNALQGPLAVVGISSTQFSVQCHNNPGAGGLNFSWKVFTQNRNAPWVGNLNPTAMGANGTGLFWKVLYEMA